MRLLSERTGASGFRAEGRDQLQRAEPGGSSVVPCHPSPPYRPLLHGPLGNAQGARGIADRAGGSWRMGSCPSTTADHQSMNRRNVEAVPPTVAANARTVIGRPTTRLTAPPTTVSSPVRPTVGVLPAA